MNYIELFGKNIKEDIDEIRRAIDNNSDIVFVYAGEDTLYDYIDTLYDKGQGLDEVYLYKFKVCYEKKDLGISYSIKNGKRNRDILSMSSLINELDGKSNCRIVVENDERVQLAFIVQQLIFIEYPLEKVDILLRKEERDADKTKRFMMNVDELLEGCKKAITGLVELRYQTECESDENNSTKVDRLKDIDEAINSCYVIEEQIIKSINVELKFAVAASKKAGKSVIVNCFLGEQIAPTSTELATPNNCIYKKSPDKMYHLRLEGGEIQDFEKREEIYDVINSYFRHAQNDKEEGFALPDMHIGYVTDENNFSSYTIFDTAGPDAAGTKHAEVAEKAMQRCDVAVFAIDYSKYLTDSEEKYLKQVKSMFAMQDKFHSLIFALNKIDVRYTDVESAKSFVKSVDFLKTRLAKIDRAYKDCIIFPTCSLEYFNAIAAEKAGVTELKKERELPIGKMKDVKFAHRDIPELAWLHTHAENLEYYHGIQTISYDVFKKDSGMPALMSYVSYVAQSKARDEIVNSITFKIAAQETKIQGILNHISNIEALINANDEKIDQITQAIADYAQNVRMILDNKFSQDELKCLGTQSILGTKKGDYEKIVDHQKEAIKFSCNNVSVAEAMYGRATEIMWKRVECNKEIDGNQIDKLFTTSDFKDVAKLVAKEKIEMSAENTFEQLTKVSNDVKKIVGCRQQELQKQSDICRERLAKENINIELPKLPKFEFATIMSPPSEEIVEVGNIDFKLYQNFSSLFKKEFIKNIGIFFRKLFAKANEKDYKRKFLGTKDTFMKKCEEHFKVEFKNVVYEKEIAKVIEKELTKSVVDGYMDALIKEIKQGFSDMNEAYMSSVKRFESSIDDRDKYKADIELLNLRKSNIVSIRNCTNNFMEVWDRIIHDFIVEG